MRPDCRDTDVIVVGGGPAGSTCAALLARAGFRVLLLDRARFPRDKPCGEFLTLGAARILQEEGVWHSVVAAGANPVESVELHARRGRFVRHTPPDGPAGWAIRRAVLDRALLEHARASGAEVVEGASVRGLVRESGRVAGVLVILSPRPPSPERRSELGCPHAEDSTRQGGGWGVAESTTGRRVGRAGESACITSRLVIGADGSHSLVARELGLVRPIPRLHRVAIVSHWRGIAQCAGIEMRARGQTVCGLGALGSGEANVSLVVPTSDAARLAGRKTDFLNERIRDAFPDLAEMLAGAECEPQVLTIGCFGHLTRRASAAGAMLVGDAAAFVDPFTGEGIYFALRGAQLAAKVAAEAVRVGDTSARRLSAYDEARRELTERYRLCDMVQRVVRSPLLIDRAVLSLSRRPALRDRLMDVLTDVRSPRGVTSPGFALLLFA